MSQEFFTQFNENSQKIYEPWSKLNKAFLKNAEMMTEFSLSTIKSYSEMGLEHLRQYSQVDSAESAKEFNTKQSEIMNTYSQKILEDTQRLAEIGNEMRTEVTKVMGEIYGDSTENMQTAMKETADKAAKKASEFTQNMTDQMSKMAEQATTAATQATSKTTAATETKTTTNKTKTTKAAQAKTTK